jgi:predicted Zn-dependent peptidase
LSVKYNRERIAPGIYFNTLINTPLKTNTLTVQFVSPITAQTAASTAVLPIYLADTNANYPTEKALSLKLQQLYGANVSDGTMKLGDSQNIQLTASCINNKYAIDNEKVTEELSAILFDCLFNPYLVNNTFDDSLFSLKRGELTDSIMSEINDKRPYAFRRAGRVIYEGEAAAVAYQGELAEAKTLTPDIAYARYNTLTEQALIDISFAGQSEDDAKAVLQNVVAPAIAKLRRSYSEFTHFEKSPLKSSMRRVTEYLDVAQSKMVMAYKVKEFDPTVNAPHIMALLNAVIGGTPSSKLFMNVREKLSLCYYCSSIYNDYKGCLAVDSGVEGDNALKAEEEIARQIALAKAGEITADEIDNAKRQIINAARTINDSAGAMIAWYFARNFSGNYSEAPESPEQRIAKTQTITKDELVAAANTLEPDSIYLLTSQAAGGAVNE